MNKHQVKSNFFTVLALLVLAYIFTPFGNVVNNFLVSKGYVEEIGNERGDLSVMTYNAQPISETPTAEYVPSPTDVPMPTQVPQQFDGTVPVNNPTQARLAGNDGDGDSQRSSEPGQQQQMGTASNSNGNGDTKVLIWRDTNENCMIDSGEQSPGALIDVRDSNGNEKRIAADQSGAVMVNRGDMVIMFGNGFYVESGAVSPNLDAYSVTEVHGVFYVKISSDHAYTGKCP